MDSKREVILSWIVEKMRENGFFQLTSYYGCCANCPNRIDERRQEDLERSIIEEQEIYVQMLEEVDLESILWLTRKAGSLSHCRKNSRVEPDATHSINGWYLGSDGPIFY